MEKEPKHGWTIAAIVGLIIALASLGVAYRQLTQQLKDSESQDSAQATLVYILDQQLTLQSAILTQQALASTPGAPQDISATQVVVLQSTLAALEKEKSLLDPLGDSTGSSYLDITSVAAALLPDGSLRMEIKVNGDIPSSPSKYLAYVWGIDSDNDSKTGYARYFFSNDIGVDYLFRAAYDNGRWNAWLDKAGKDGKAEWSKPVSDFYVSGNTVTVTSKLDLIGSPTSFSWTVHTLEGTKYADVAPNSGHYSFP